MPAPDVARPWHSQGAPELCLSVETPSSPPSRRTTAPTSRCRILLSACLRPCSRDDVCQQSLEALEDIAGLSRKSVQTVLRALLAAGVIVKEGTGHGRHANRYRLLLPAGRRMTPLSHLLPPLPTSPLPQTYAPWPVWSDSTTAPIRFQPMPKKAAVRLWHRARDFDRGTHEPGRHGGAVGPTALQVLHALIFDFLNHRTGRSPTVPHYPIFFAPEAGRHGNRVACPLRPERRNK